jgi:tetratricopeptide (TPR) repeat protein
VRSRYVLAIALIVVTNVTRAAVVSTRPASGPTEADRQKVSALSRHAADLIEQHKFSDAERVLQEALSLNPQNTTCLYDLAGVDVALDRREDAIAILERATDAGFTDFTQIENNPAFTVLRDMPRYQGLLSRKDEIRHRTAERILDDLKTQFGERYMYVVDESRKIVFADGLGQQSLDELQSAIRWQLVSQHEQVFSHASDEFIRVIVATPADFARLEHRPGVSGSYDDSSRTVLVKRLGPELRHEFTHALHAADQHALDQEHPVWLSEGLATLYEYPTFEVSGDGARRLIPADTWRLVRVQAAANHNNLIPIDKLVGMNRLMFTERAELAYGESGSLLLYLCERGLLKRFYDEYTRGYAVDSAGLEALTKTTGMSISSLQKAWVDWLLPRPVPVRTSEIIP